jgi:hypothetical protein
MQQMRDRWAQQDREAAADARADAERFSRMNSDIERSNQADRLNDELRRLRGSVDSLERNQRRY